MDASVVIKVLWPEEDSDIADRLLERLGGRLAAPALLPFEVANAIWKNPTLSGAEKAAALGSFHGLGIRVVPPDHALMGEALQLAVKHGVTAYDASYLALARLLDARFLTADERLVRRLRDPRVVPLSEDPPEDIAG